MNSFGSSSGSGLGHELVFFWWFCTRTGLILQAPPNSHPFVLKGLVRAKTFFTLLLGVTYSVSKSDSSSSSEVRNYDHHRWETNKQMRETNTPSVPLTCSCLTTVNDEKMFTAL